MVLLSSATFSAYWTSYSKTQLRVSASELALQLAQPDIASEDAKAFQVSKLERQFNNWPIEVENSSNFGLSGVQITLKPGSLLGLPGVSIPEIRVETHAANEI